MTVASKNGEVPDRVAIRRALISAVVRYEDARGIYPHIYGPLDREAIVAVLPARRLPRGAFVLP